MAAAGRGPSARADLAPRRAAVRADLWAAYSPGNPAYDAIRAHLPADERWLYLRIAGVRPDCQGKGLGGLAIRAGHAEAAARGVPVVLETATPSNVGLYQNLGYAVVSEWHVPGGGPQFWSMTNLAPAMAPAA